MGLLPGHRLRKVSLSTELGNLMSIILVASHNLGKRNRRLVAGRACNPAPRREGGGKAKCNRAGPGCVTSVAHGHAR